MQCLFKNSRYPSIHQSLPFLTFKQAMDIWHCIRIVSIFFISEQKKLIKYRMKIKIFLNPFSKKKKNRERTDHGVKILTCFLIFVWVEARTISLPFTFDDLPRFAYNEHTKQAKITNKQRGRALDTRKEEERKRGGTCCVFALSIAIAWWYLVVVNKG